MLIGVAKRFLFVANTKTASTSIEQVLLRHTDIIRTGTPQRKHTPLHKVLQSYPFLFRRPGHEPGTYFKFGVMREPLDWIGSWYRYRRGNAMVEDPLPADMSFAEFWSRRDWNIMRPNGAPHLQCDMFAGPKGKVLADAIIPYHRLGEMFGEICGHLKIDGRLPRENVSPTGDVGDLPESLIEEMRAFYAEDYALWERLDEINATGLERLRARGG